VTIRTVFYEMMLRFPRLFPDPVLFEDPSRLANRYLMLNGLSAEKSTLIGQASEEILTLDDRGKASVTAGTARYSFEGRVILAEYMANANVPLTYADYGTGLTPEDHSRLWTKGKLGELRFELREFKHQSRTLNLPDVSELYMILKERASPTTISTVELEGVPGPLFRSVVSYIKGVLQASAKADGLEVEVYAAKDLTAFEKSKLEKRLTRESSKTAVFVILSRETSSNSTSSIK
jgi:hypothetical protein